MKKLVNISTEKLIPLFGTYVSLYCAAIEGTDSDV